MLSALSDISGQPPQSHPATTAQYNGFVMAIDTFTCFHSFLAKQHSTRVANMANLKTVFDTLLKGHEAAPTKSFSPDTADEFLKEAYRIVRSSAGGFSSQRRRADPLRPRTPSSPACTPSCAICVKHISRPPPLGRHTYALPHPVQLHHNLPTSPTGTGRKSTPMQR